ncbi:hypothetical protein [Streptomyces albidoflavus]|uniref:hypothetical protein n=1 Tax=Streptomyces albidoflavus TaxID=1886 RepID=UPI0033EF2D92
MHSLTLYVGQSGIADEQPSLHKCPSCAGRGFFCKHTPTCGVPHTEATRVIRSHDLPPV